MGATKTNGTPRLGIKNNNSLHDKKEIRQLKANNNADEFRKGFKWADPILQVKNAKPHCKKRCKRLLSIINGGREEFGVYYGPKVILVFQSPDSTRS